MNLAKITNAVLFNLSWFAIVLTQSSVIAPVIVAAHLLVHFYLMGNGRGEGILVAGMLLFGAVADQLLFLTGVFNVDGQPAPAPLWMSCLWPVFATTLMHAFEGFRHRILTAAVFGAVGGALSYIAGVRLTAVEFGSLLWGPVIVGALWAIIFPLSLRVSVRASGRHADLQSWEPANRQAHD